MPRCLRGLGLGDAFGHSGRVGGRFFGQVGYSGPPPHQGVCVCLRLGGVLVVHRRGIGGLSEGADLGLRRRQKVLLRLKQSPAEEEENEETTPAAVVSVVKSRLEISSAGRTMTRVTVPTWGASSTRPAGQSGLYRYRCRLGSQAKASFCLEHCPTPLGYSQNLPQTRSRPQH